MHSDEELRHPWHTSVEHFPPEVCTKLAPLAQRLRNGGAIFEIRDPFAHGSATTVNMPASPMIPPAERWRSPNEEQGLKAVAARWENQLAAAFTNGVDPVVPSGVGNRGLTEGLRRFADKKDERDTVEVRIIYRDGSEAHRFPLGSLQFVRGFPTDVKVLRVALISLSRPELDIKVDLAWLRNRDISQIQQQAQIDDLVYEVSRKQLKDLSGHGPRIIYLYQIGLEPAIVGFYRALVQNLLAYPGSIAVSPRFCLRNRQLEEGTAWVTQIKV